MSQKYNFFSSEDKNQVSDSDIEKETRNKEINENIDGAVNVTAPEPLQQKEFSRAIAKIMDKAFFAPPLPPIIMRLAVGWELGEQLGLNSIRAIPQKLLKEGFQFKNPTLETMKDDFI